MHTESQLILLKSFVVELITAVLLDVSLRPTLSRHERTQIAILGYVPQPNFTDLRYADALCMQHN